ncbi:flagellar hook-length control protein FliK [Cupriavidus basilensis]
MVRLSTQGNHTAELQLNPPDLGPLKVVLNVVNDQAQAQFVSPHAAVRAAVEASAAAVAHRAGGQRHPAWPDLGRRRQLCRPGRQRSAATATPARRPAKRLRHAGRRHHGACQCRPPPRRWRAPSRAARSTPSPDRTRATGAAAPMPQAPQQPRAFALTMSF